MISLEQWRAAVGGWNAGKLSAIYRRYGSRRIVRNWAKLLLVMDSYTAVIYYALYWLIAGLFAFMSSDGWIIALSVVFDDACGYPHDIRRALLESPTATVFHVSHDYLQRFWVFASPTVAPLLRSCMIRLQRLWKLASPSVSSMLRLLIALNWLLIVAGDVELNPGPVSQELEKLLKTTNTSVLKEDDLLSVYREVLDLAINWMDVGLVLGLRHTDLSDISTTNREKPKDCLKEALARWLKQDYDIDRNGLPTWKKMVEVAADPIVENPALATTLAQNHQGTAQTARSNPRQAKLSTDASSKAVPRYAQYLRDSYQTQIPTFLTFQWPPPPTRKIFNLAMIQRQNIRHGPIDEEMVRLTGQGKVNDILYQKTPVELKDILEKDKAMRKVILIEGAPGSGKSTLAWHVCQKWGSEKLFQDFRTVIHVQLRDPAIQSAKSVEDLIPAESRDQAETVMAEFRSCRGRDLLIVLDGWDELPSGLHTKSIFQQLIAFPETLNLHYSAVIVTSRPIASSDLYRTISSRVEILGFTPSEVKEYFTEALGGESQAVQKLQDQLKESPMVEASCSLPLNAAIVSHLFLVQEYSLPTTLHGVFMMLVLCCLKRHVVKKEQEREKHITSLDNLPSDIDLMFKDVCALAYHGVMDNRITFPVEYMESCGLPEITETLGLIQGVESLTSLDSSRSYYFLHPSVQELLASFYISKLSGNEQVVEFKKLFGEPRFAAVFQFYTAFTKLKTESIRSMVADIVQKKEKNQMLYLLHGLYEAQTLSLCQFVYSQLGGELNLSNTTLSPVDCLAVGYFISCICLNGSGEFKAALEKCNIDSYRVSYLTKEHKFAATDAGVSSGLELNLHLNDNSVGDEAALLCGGNFNPSLRTLNLRSNGLSNNAVSAISEALKVNQSLTALDLSYNAMSDNAGSAIGEALKVNKCLTELDLSYNAMSDSAGSAIGEALKVNQCLTKLDLRKNKISFGGGKAIAEGLKVNRTLTTLNLSYNEMSDNAVTAIAEALKDNQSLTELDLSYNAMSDDAGSEIGEALKVNKSLTELDLRSNGISDEGGRVIAEGLKDNRKLTALDLSSNLISDEGATAITAALRVNKSLTELRLWGNAGISSEMERLLQEDFPGRVDAN